MDFFKWHIQTKEEDEKEKAAFKNKDWINAERSRLLNHWEKSREYRVMLQNYLSELKEREKELDQRELELDQRENTIRQTVLNSIYAEKDKVNQEVASQREYMYALRETESVIMDWLKRKERNEQELFDEIILDANKFQESKIVMDGFAFEEYVANLMQKNGFHNVEVTKKTGDYGADVIAQKDEIKYVVQCKYYKSLVGIEAVQQIYSAKKYYRAHVAIVATNSVFTKAAKTLASQLNVVLWDCDAIKKMES